MVMEGDRGRSPGQQCQETAHHDGEGTGPLPRSRYPPCIPDDAQHFQRHGSHREEREHQWARAIVEEWLVHRDIGTREEKTCDDDLGRPAEPLSGVYRARCHGPQAVREFVVTKDASHPTLEAVGDSAARPRPNTSVNAIGPGLDGPARS